MSDKHSELWYQCRDYLWEMSEGEWYSTIMDRLLRRDTDKFEAFVREQIRYAQKDK